MKKTLAILVAVLLVALSIFPAFTAEIISPKPTTGNYQVVIIPGPGGGSYDFTYKTPVDDDGNQTVHFTAKPDDGYKFTGWTFEGDYTALGNLTDTDLDLIIRGDIKAYPKFEKIGSKDKGSDSKAKVDDSSKSPKTGADYIYVGIASAALLGLLFASKKFFYKK